jgi:molybdopterin-guanine dinucleotide biosynthesis protein A
MSAANRHIEGFILAGGASRRMGEDKAALLYDGRSFVAHIAQTLMAVTRRVSIVGALPPKDAGRLPFVPDIYAQWGALGGLHAALAACQTEWAAVVACDLPLVSAALLQHLASLREDFDAVAPVQADGYPQALCAFYRVAKCRDCAQQLIASGERRPRTLLRAVRTRWVTPAEITDLPNAERLLLNVNTPLEYGEIQSRAN